MREPGQHLEPLDWGGNALDELPLGRRLHHPVRAGGKHEQRHRDGAGVVQQPRRGIVQVEQHVDGDLPEDERVGVVACGFHRVVGDIYHCRLQLPLEQVQLAA